MPSTPFGTLGTTYFAAQVHKERQRVEHMALLNRSLASHSARVIAEARAEVRNQRQELDQLRTRVHNEWAVVSAANRARVGKVAKDVAVTPRMARQRARTDGQIFGAVTWSSLPPSTPQSQVTSFTPSFQKALRE